MAEIPNTRFINFADAPVAVVYDQFGSAHVNLDPQVGGIIDLSGFRRVSIRIGTTKATSFVVNMGKISGATLSQAFSRAVDSQIHTFEVIGPQMNLSLKGAAPSTQEKVQLWVYLRS